MRALSQPRVYALFARSLATTGRDLDAFVNSSVKGFPGYELARKIRRRPSAPLLALLARRLRRFDLERLEARIRAGERVAAALPARVRRPGIDAVDPTHWVFPVLAADRDGLVSHLRREGFDAATATSSIDTVPAPPDRPDLRPTRAEQAIAEVVFIPAYPELGDEELDRLAESVAGALAKSQERGLLGRRLHADAPGTTSYFLNEKRAVWTVLSRSLTTSCRHVPDQPFSVFQL